MAIFVTRLEVTTVQAIKIPQHLLPVEQRPEYVKGGLCSQISLDVGFEIIRGLEKCC